MRPVNCALLALALCALSVSPSSGQEQKTAPVPEKKADPVIKIYMAGKDTVVLVPKGIDYLPEKSKYLGTVPTIVVEKMEDGGQKLIMRERAADVSQVGGSKVTIRFGGVVGAPKVFVGIPEGAKYDDQTKKKEEPPKK